jgi:protein-tyrosine phosphatase
VSENSGSKKIVIGCIEDLDYDNSPPYSSSAAVINCLTGNGEEKVVNGKPVLEMRLYDDGHISNYAFDLAVEFINKHVDKGEILVACEAGTSRSVTVGAAYYMSLGKTYHEALKLLNRGPPGVLHNISLLSWAQKKGYISEEERKKLDYSKK